MPVKVDWVVRPADIAFSLHLQLTVRRAHEVGYKMIIILCTRHMLEIISGATAVCRKVFVLSCLFPIYFLN